MRKIIKAVIDLIFPEKDSYKILDIYKLIDKAEPKLFFVEPITFSLFDYKIPEIKEMIWKAKYHNSRKTSEILAKCIYEITLKSKFWNNLKNTYPSDKLKHSKETPVIVPIPSSKKKAGEKGYNQCFRIADTLKEIDNDKNFEVRKDILFKIKETKPQARTKNKKERIQNLKDAFWAKINSSENEMNCQIINRPIIILDDVITTGTTLKECALALKKAGFKKVFGLTVAYQLKK